jgi:integrase
MGKRARNGQGSIYETTFVDKRSGKTVKRWQGQVVIPQELGEPKRKTVYGKTYAAVKEKMDTLTRQVADGTASNTSQTVGQYLERWLKEKERQVKPRTIELYGDWANRHVNPRIGKVQLAKLTPLQVQTMMGDLADKVGVSTANKCRKMLYGALKQGVRWQILSRNVCDAVDPLKEERREMRIWETAEAVRFLDAIRAHRYYAAFYLAMATGLRRGELLGLMWSDLRGDSVYIQRTLTIINKKPAFSTPKTKRGTRFVTLPPDAIDVLERHRKLQEAEAAFLSEAWPNTGLIFTSAVGTPVDPRDFNKRFAALQVQAEVPHVRLHDLRHLHVSLLVRRGVDPRTIADRIGHTDSSFTLRWYAHMFEEQRRAAAVNLSDLLGSSTAPANLN